MQNNPVGLTGADHFSWTVADLEPVLEFYQRVFGAELLYRVGPLNTGEFPFEHSGKGWSEARLGIVDAHIKFAVIKLPGDIRIELFQFFYPNSDTTKPPLNNNIGASHLGVAVADLSAAATYLAANGCTVMQRIDSPPDSATAGISYHYLHDPWGNVLELCGRYASPNVQ